MRKRGNIKIFELEEIIFILLNCLDQDKKLNKEVVNTLKTYITHHECEILNYVFSFLQIQKVSHENQKYLLYLIYDIIYYSVYNSFSNIFDEYFENEKKGKDGKKNEDKKDNEKKNENVKISKNESNKQGIMSMENNINDYIIDINIFNNIIKYTFFDGDEYCFIYNNEFGDNNNDHDNNYEPMELKDKMINENSSNYSVRNIRNIGSLNFCGNTNSLNLFTHNKISFLKCVKKEIYKILLVNKKKSASDKLVMCCTDNIYNKHNIKNSEINKIIKNIINFILNEMIFIKKNDERHAIMTKLLILCIMKEDYYLKKKLIEKINYYILENKSETNEDCKDNDNGNNNSLSNTPKKNNNNNCRINSNVYIYLDLYIDIFMQVPHLSKNVLIDIFKIIAHLIHNNSDNTTNNISNNSNNNKKHIDMMHKIFLKIFYNLHFPSILYNIINMDEKYKNQNFIIFPNKNNANVYIENNVIHLSLENTSEDTCTTYTRNSSVNSKVCKQVSNSYVFNDNLNYNQLYQGNMKNKDNSMNKMISNKVSDEDMVVKNNGECIVNSIGIETEKEESKTKKTTKINERAFSKGSENENNILAYSKENNKLICQNNSENLDKHFSINSESLNELNNGLNKFSGLRSDEKENSYEKKNRHENCDAIQNSKIVRGIKRNESSISPSKYSEIIKTGREDIHDVCIQILNKYLNIILDIKYNHENYTRILYIISKLCLYINNDDSIKNVLEIFIFYFFSFFNATINNILIHDISSIYNNDSKIHINYKALKELPNFNIIKSFRIILQHSLSKIEHIVMFTNQILTLNYYFLYILINQNCSINNSGDIIKKIASNLYKWTYIEIVEIFNIFISCIYTNNYVFNFLNEKLKLDNKIDIIASLLVLKQYIVLISSDLSNHNISYISNQNIKKEYDVYNGDQDDWKSNGCYHKEYTKCFTNLNSFISDIQNINANIEIIIQIISTVCERFNKDLNIIYLVLEISLLLSYNEYFNYYSYNPNVIFGLLPNIYSPLTVMRIKNKKTQNLIIDQIKSKSVFQIKQNVISSSEKCTLNNINFEGNTKNNENHIYNEFYKQKKDNMDENTEHIEKSKDNKEESSVNEINTWAVIPNKYIINIFQLFINILLNEEECSRMKNRNYGYSVDKGDIIYITQNESNNTSNQFYRNDNTVDNNCLTKINIIVHNQMFYDMYDHFFIYMHPSVTYIKRLISEAFQYNFSIYSARVLYPLLFEYLMNIKINYKIVIILLKCLNIICISLYNYMSVQNLRIHSNFHFNFLILPNMSQIMSILFMYCYHENYVISFLSLQLISILRIFTQNTSIKNVQSLTYFDLMLNILKWCFKIKDKDNIRKFDSIFSEEKYNRNISKDINRSGYNNTIQKTEKKRKYYKMLIKLCYIKIAKIISKKLLNTYLKSYSLKYVKKSTNRKINRIISTYFNLDVKQIENLIQRYDIDYNNNVSNMNASNLMNVNAEVKENINITLFENFEYINKNIHKIIKLSSKFFNNYVKLEINSIFNPQTYVITFFCILIEQLKIVQNNLEFENNTLFYITTLNMLCIISKYLPKNYTNILITIFFKLNPDVSINENENFLLSLYYNFSYIYKTHIFNLYKEKCTTLHTKNCIESIHLIRKDINSMHLKKYSDNQIDFNNFMLLSNTYNSDISKQKNIESVLNFIYKYIKVYNSNIKNAFDYFIEEKHKKQMNNVGKSDPSLLYKLKNALDKKNQVIQKLVDLLESKLGIYILQTDINYSIGNIFKQEMVSYYVESIVNKKNVVWMLYLLNNIYYSDIANKKGSAFSLFGKSANVIHSENMRNTLILSMGVCLEKITKTIKFEDLYKMNQIYVNNEIFAIYVKCVYNNISKYSCYFKNIFFNKKDQSQINYGAIEKDIIQNRQKYAEKMFKDEINQHIKNKNELFAFLNKEQNATYLNDFTKLNFKDVIQKYACNENYSFFIFELLVDPIIIALYQEKEPCLQKTLIKSLKKIAKQLKKIKYTNNFKENYNSQEDNSLEWEEENGSISDLGKEKKKEFSDFSQKVNRKEDKYNCISFLDTKNKECIVDDICENYIKNNSINSDKFYSCLYLYKFIIIYSSLCCISNISNNPIPISGDISIYNVDKFVVFFKSSNDNNKNNSGNIFEYSDKSEYYFREEIIKNNISGSQMAKNEKDLNEKKNDSFYIREIDKVNKKIEQESFDSTPPLQTNKQDGVPSDNKLFDRNISNDSYEILLISLKTIYYCLYIKQYPLNMQTILIIFDVLVNLFLKLVLDQKDKIHKKLMESKSKEDKQTANEGKANNYGKQIDTDKIKNKEISNQIDKKRFKKWDETKRKKKSDKNTISFIDGAYSIVKKNVRSKNFESIPNSVYGEEIYENINKNRKRTISNDNNYTKKPYMNSSNNTNHSKDTEQIEKKTSDVLIDSFINEVKDEHKINNINEQMSYPFSKRIVKNNMNCSKDIFKGGNRNSNSSIIVYNNEYIKWNKQKEKILINNRVRKLEKEKWIGKNNKIFYNFSKYEKVSLLCLNYIICILVKAVSNMNYFPFIIKLIKYMHNTYISTNIDEVKFVVFRIITEIVINSPFLSQKWKTEPVANHKIKVEKKSNGYKSEEIMLDDSDTKEYREDSYLLRDEEKKEKYNNEVSNDNNNKNTEGIKSILSYNSSNFEKYINLVFSNNNNNIIPYDNLIDLNNSDEKREEIFLETQPENIRTNPSDDDKSSQSHYNPISEDNNKKHEKDKLNETTKDKDTLDSCEGDIFNTIPEVVKQDKILDIINNNFRKDEKTNLDKLENINLKKYEKKKYKYGQPNGRNNQKIYLCECLGLLIPYIKDKEQIIRYFSIYSICILIGKLKGFKIVNKNHFIYFFLNPLDIIINMLHKLDMANSRRKGKKFTSMEKKKTYIKSKMIKSKTKTKLSIPLERINNKNKNYLDDNANYDKDGNYNYEQAIKGSKMLNIENINENSFENDNKINEDSKHIYYNEKLIKNRVMCEQSNKNLNTMSDKLLKLCKNKKYYYKKINNLYNIEFHNDFCKSIEKKMKEIYNEKYQTNITNKLRKIFVHNKRNEIDIIKNYKKLPNIINYVINEYFTEKEKKSYINSLFSCIHNKNKNVSIYGINLLMYNISNKKIDKNSIETVMNRIFSELYYYTKANVLINVSKDITAIKNDRKNINENDQNKNDNNSNNSKDHASEKKELNETLEIYRNICLEIKKKEEKKNILEKYLYIILLMCRKHFYVMINKLCTLQSKYNYEHIYFIYMICNNEILLYKTLDYLFYILNNLNILKLNNNLSNILSLLFHILKFRNKFIKKYSQKYYVELFLIVFYVLGVKQLSHINTSQEIDKSERVGNNKYNSNFNRNGSIIYNNLNIKSVFENFSLDKTNVLGNYIKMVPSSVEKDNKDDDNNNINNETFGKQNVYENEKNYYNAIGSETNDDKDAREGNNENIDYMNKIEGKISSKYSEGDNNNDIERIEIGIQNSECPKAPIFEEKLTSSHFFIKRNGEFRFTNMKKISKEEYNKKIYKNYTCSISVNNSLNCLNIIKEILKLNKKKKILNYYKNNNLEKLLYYKHSFESGLIKYIYIFLKNNNDCSKAFNFLNFFIKSNNINYIIISLIILSQIPLCVFALKDRRDVVSVNTSEIPSTVSYLSKNLKIIKPMVSVLYYISCKYKNSYVTKYLHISFKNLFIIFKDVINYQKNNNMEIFSLYINEKYALNILNSLFINLFNNDQNCIKNALKAFKQACKYESKFWPSNACASFINTLCNPNIIFIYLNSNETMEKIYICKILCEVFKTMHREKENAIRKKNEQKTFVELKSHHNYMCNLKKKHIYEIATYLMIHLVDKRKNVSLNVWLALKELIKFKFSDHAKPTLNFFYYKMFVSDDEKHDFEENYKSAKKKKKNMKKRKDQKRDTPININNNTNTDTFVQKHNHNVDEQIKDMNMIYYGEKKHITDHKTQIDDTINNPPCENFLKKEKRNKKKMSIVKRAYNYTDPSNIIVGELYQSSNLKNGNLFVYNTDKGNGATEKKILINNDKTNKIKKNNTIKITKKRTYITTGNSDHDRINKMNKQIGNSESENTCNNKTQKINMYYYKLFIEIFIPLIICIDTKISYRKNLFISIYKYLAEKKYEENHARNNSLFQICDHTELYNIFFSEIKLSLKNINSIYRAYIILLNSRKCFHKKLWNINMPISEDVMNMIKEYNSKSTKHRAEYVLFGDLKNYIYAQKMKNEQNDNNKNEDSGEIKNNIIAKDFTTSITNSIMNTFSETFNYSYDNFFWNNNNLSKSNSADISKNHKNVAGNDQRELQNYLSQGEDNTYEYNSEKSESIHNNNIINNECKNDELHNYEQTGDREKQIEQNSHTLKNNEEKQNCNTDENFNSTNRKKEKNNINIRNSYGSEQNNGITFESQLKGNLKKYITSFNKNIGNRENYCIYISSSDEEDELEKNTPVNSEIAKRENDTTIVNEDGSKRKEQTPMKKKNVLINYYENRNYLKRKFNKLEQLNKRYNFINQFKNIQSLNINDNLLHWIEMLKFLKEDPPQVILSKDNKFVENFDFFESSLVCSLTVIKLVSLKLNIRKLHKMARNSMLIDSETYQKNVGDESNSRLNRDKIIEDENTHEHKIMEEMYYMHLLYISTKLEALSSTITKQLSTYLQGDKTDLHFPIIKSLSILSILKPYS
ncbi:conserved Plasmodium protein, unknown function [Plasmodium berghei]|uniref:Uncharacterized protein n=2 Tax=Plasmodium berghei TaxID=5821 RepID=A0A509AND4_PLABA|nr:conserved Plasmodium protein, unknown function [Plasmodium berghei ANKA]CXI30022.1 conserved Plasmodium protein, unknown function [Plasmodium berghei]SCM20809.1 conserved Plasmodium protein, unknown function [Plasmodium berghei]SCN24332.1 conserved Plasmodium protein, unknown function [Plasmodium berghei]SCO59505.1 conserved Plasmodium protein, unknown function [Plasmodium berghei]SCO60735.1 conserved Plasmodium protein, unknown function [Plasmodium berghei]|eukprot:XP_034421037.1 conserved Plasmodium protein, unknown function [Plasmodium berghei ANKA]